MARRTIFMVLRTSKLDPPPKELKHASFHELASVNKIAEVLKASLIVRPFFEGYTRYFRQTFIRIFEVKQTLAFGVYSVCESHMRSTTERLALRTPASLFTYSWKIASRGWPSNPGGTRYLISSDVWEAPMMSRGVSLSGRCTPDRCRNSSR